MHQTTCHVQILPRDDDWGACCGSLTDQWNDEPRIPFALALIYFAKRPQPEPQDDP